MIGPDHYFLGLPAWAFPGWQDRYFGEAPSRLASYAQVFNAVEGNTTFYRTPDAVSVARWLDAVDCETFRFCFKLPREVTHERRPNRFALNEFLGAIAPLGDSVGPLLVQFPATVGPDELNQFAPVLDAVAERFEFVVEVRHAAFFDDPERLAPTLARYGAGRVILDSRPLFEGDRSHPELLKALHQKPDVPVIPLVYNGVTMVRLILHPDIVSNEPYIGEWAERVAGWLADGVTVYMMIHCPNNLHCPPLAQSFQAALRRAAPALEIPPLPPWPVPQQQALL
jgi:uncharacterized protein YecE (DUF72 family)